MITKRRWILGILLLLILVMPSTVALADCRITSSSSSNDTVVCSNPADTNGINTGSGNDTITVNADTSVSAPSGVTAIDAGYGDDRLYQRGTINAVSDAIQLGRGNDTLYNYGSATASDDGFGCHPGAGQTCTMYNYGSVTARNEVIDIVSSGGRFVLRNSSSGVITSQEQEAVHLNGSGTHEVINEGTLRVNVRQVIEEYGGTLILNNSGTIENTGGFPAVQSYTASDSITNRGRIIAVGGAAIYTHGGNDTINSYGTTQSTNSSANRGAIEAGSGNDIITVYSGSVADTSSGVSIEAGTGSDSVIIRGGSIPDLIDGDEVGSSGDSDTLTFRFTGTQAEIDAFRSAMNGKSPSGGSVTWRNNTYRWSGFERIVLDLRVG